MASKPPLDGKIDGSESIVSRSSTIKSILLAAWRAKLTDQEWESRMRKVLPKGVNGDVYDLAECLLKQALVGPVPNQLFMSYLKHAVNCELVSYGAVFASIANQSIPNRATSIICLLEFLETFRDQLSCSGSEVDCVNLCKSLGQLIHWLLKCVHQSLISLNDNPNNNIGRNNNNHLISSSYSQSNPATGGNIFTNLTNNPNFNNSSTNNDNSPLISIITSTSNSYSHNDIIINIIDLCADIILNLFSNSFTKSLLFISTIESKDTFELILRLLDIIKEKMNSIQQLNHTIKFTQNINSLKKLNINFKSEDMHPSRLASEQLRCIKMNRTRSTLIASEVNLEKTRKLSQSNIDSTTNYALFNTLYPLVAFDVNLRPARSHELLARQITTITNFNSAPISMTYCELIRVCLVGLVDTAKSPAKTKWAFFTFLKLPKLLLELSKVCKNPLLINNNQLVPFNPSDNYASNQNTNFVTDLKIAIERLCEYSPLLDGAEYKCNCDFFKCLVRELLKKDPGLVSLKTIDLRKFPTKRPATISDDNAGVGAHIMLRTESVVASFLKALDPDSNPNDLFTFLSQLVNGKQFEFTLGGAASTGRLEVFVRRLVEQNELNIISQSDKHAHAQALVFDITFLILTYIAQQYGPEVIGSDAKRTFERWYIDYYNQETRINCPIEIIKSCKDEVADDLLMQIIDPNSSIKMAKVDWRNVCFNIPKVMNDILNAWDLGYLNDDDINAICEKMKSKMCFIAVVAAVWLQCHIRVLSESDRIRPMFMLYNLTKASQIAKTQQKVPQAPNSGLKSESYTERSSLMTHIIKKLYFEFVPNGHGSTSAQQVPSGPGNGSQGNSTSNVVDITSSEKIEVANPNDNGRIADNSSDNSNNQTHSSETLDSTCHAINDRFISLQSSQDLFLSNVKLSLHRGWIDHKSLTSLSSLFKMIGSECFTNLIVHRILTGHESPGDLARAVNISFGLFHLDLDACCFALLKDTIPGWLLGEKKQQTLNQPRAYALAHLSVMTIIEVFNNLKTNQLIYAGILGSSGNTNAHEFERTTRKVIVLNGIKQESNPEVNNPFAGPQAKKMKLTQEEERQELAKDNNNQQQQQKLTIRDNKKDPSKSAIDKIDEKIRLLNGLVEKLMRLFRQIMSDKVMSNRTLFPLLFLQQTVISAREDASIITAHLEPEILLDIIKLFSSELTFELVLAFSNLSDPLSRRFAAKATCELANRQNKPLTYEEKRLRQVEKEKLKKQRQEREQNQPQQQPASQQSQQAGQDQSLETSGRPRAIPTNS